MKIMSLPKELIIIISSYIQDEITLISISDVLHLENIDYFNLLRFEYPHLFSDVKNCLILLIKKNIERTNWRSLWFSIIRIKEYNYLDILSPNLIDMIAEEDDVDVRFNADFNILSFIMNIGRTDIYELLIPHDDMYSKIQYFIEQWTHENILSKNYLEFPIGIVLRYFDSIDIMVYMKHRNYNFNILIDNLQDELGKVDINLIKKLKPYFKALVDEFEDVDSLILKKTKENK